MADTIDLDFPTGFSKEAAKTLTEQLAKLEGVDRSALYARRAIDPVSLAAWVKLAAATVPILTTIVGWIRGQGMKGVKIKVANKVTIEIDTASAADIERLVNTLG